MIRFVRTHEDAEKEAVKSIASRIPDMRVIRSNGKAARGFSVGNFLIVNRMRRTLNPRLPFNGKETEKLNC